ncbi:sulfite exporter TauE/SafE family protein [Nitrincola tapanii]|uniref:Probable membrane transporter protein n=1 Tax=Nitrincola tapanii TaxID=1708751 RepID=A0A5A9W0V8_9GAMM|nr:sulfite exporter TauE/SafE family protein [Nitrincola tapanii]KAA0874192.1 sulfite exporter TauE/SafE family protein [Nitrincola tapanii]
MSVEQGILLLLVGVLTGFMNVLSAGGSMITLPLLMFMGLDSATANGSNRVGIVMQNTTAVWRFHRSGYCDWTLALTLAIPAVVGALFGAWLATLTSEAVFQWILILVMLVSSVMMLLPQPKEQVTHPLDKEHLSWPVYLAMLLIGIYGGFIQVAVGLLFIVILYRVLKVDLIQVNVLKVLIVLVYMVPALLVFIYAGHVAWSYGLTLALGSMLGAYGAARVTLSPSGSVWIQRLSLAVIALILVKLIWDLLD